MSLFHNKAIRVARLGVVFCIGLSSITFCSDNSSKAPEKSISTKTKLVATFAATTLLVGVGALSIYLENCDKSSSIKTSTSIPKQTMAPIATAGTGNLQPLQPALLINSATIHPAAAGTTTIINHHCPPQSTSSGSTKSVMGAITGGFVGSFFRSLIPSPGSMALSAAALAVAGKTYKKTCEIQKTLDKTRQDLTNLSHENKSLHEKTHDQISSLNRNLGDVSTRMDRHQKENLEEHHKTQAKFATLESEINQHTTEKTQGLESSIAGLKGDVGLVSTQLNEVKTKIDKGFAQVIQTQRAQNRYVAEHGLCVPPAFACSFAGRAMLVPQKSSGVQQ